MNPSLTYMYRICIATSKYCKTQVHNVAPYWFPKLHVPYIYSSLYAYHTFWWCMSPNGSSSWHDMDKFEMFSYYLAAIMLMYLLIIAYIHLKVIFCAKLEKSLTRGISNFLQTTPCPHFYPLIFGPPLLTSRKHTYLCVYSGRGIWNEIKCTFICLLLCCFIHYIKTILWNKSVPYALDKSFHSKI